MKVLALDISTNAGWALLEGQMGEIPKILETGTITNDGPVSSFGDYPWSMQRAANSIAIRLVQLYIDKNPDVIVIEETNKPGRFGNRYSQKLLEFIHCHVLALLHEHTQTESAVHSKYICLPDVVYINTSDWRKIVGANLTKADKALNVKVRKLKKAGDKEGLKKLGVRGKIGKKHVAVRFVNTAYGLNLKMKDNDIADAICQGTAYFLGVKHCDGK